MTTDKKEKTTVATKEKTYKVQVKRMGKEVASYGVCIRPRKYGPPEGQEPRGIIWRYLIRVLN